MRKFLTIFFIYLISSTSCHGTKEPQKYDVDKFMDNLKKKYPEQPEFIQAVHEVVLSIIDIVNNNPKYLKNKILDRIVEVSFYF